MNDKLTETELAHLICAEWRKDLEKEESTIMTCARIVQEETCKLIGEFMCGDCEHRPTGSRTYCSSCMYNLQDQLLQGKLPEEDK